MTFSNPITKLLKGQALSRREIVAIIEDIIIFAALNVALFGSIRLAGIALEKLGVA